MSYTANTPWEQDSRALSATASIIDALGTSHTLSGNISTMQYEASNASETISMGMCNAAKMQIEFKDVAPSDISAFVKGNKINFSLLAFAEIDGQTVTDEKEYPDMFIDTVETLETTHNDGNGNYYADITAVCYDAISKMDKKYSVYGFVPVHPAISDIVLDICDRFNLEASDNWDAEYIVDELPEDISYRQVLGYLAGLQGANAYINESGELDVKFYASTSKVITQAEQYMDGLAFGEEVNITVLESGTADNVLTVGSGNIGQTISFENPLMTQSLLQSIFNARIGQGLSYFPCNVKWKGNPHIDVGDIIKCQSKDETEQTVLIMRKTLNYDGSLYEEYEAFAQPEKSIAFNNSPVLKRVKRELQSFEEAIIAATKAITQLDGSEYKLIPSPTEEGKAAGWCLKYGNSDHAIVATAGGIGFGSFQNGTFTANNAAIFFTDDGHGNVIGQINGNKIVAGSIDANAIAANAITASKIAAGSISSSKISADGITANKIIGGILQSSNGKTYFDLNNSLVRTVKSGYYQTTLGGGGVITETTSGGTIGGLVGSNSFTAGNPSETLFFASRMLIGKSSNATSDFDPYIDFYSNEIGLLKKTTSTKRISTINSDFAGFSHRKINTGTVKFGVGVVNYRTPVTAQYNSAALEFDSESESTVYSRIDVTQSWGEACGVLTLYNSSKGRSAPLELGTSLMWFNGNEVTTGSSEKFKTDINLYENSALDIINQSKVYSYKYKHDGENALKKYGLIIERECPKEIVDNSGDAISLYSMSSILWKAVQELSDKIERLGG